MTASLAGAPNWTGNAASLVQIEAADSSASAAADSSSLTYSVRFPLYLHVLDASCRVLAYLSHVRAGLWVLNGESALNIAENVAVHEGLPVAVFSMEMGASQLALRMVGSLGRIDQQRLRTGGLHDDEWGRLSEAVEKLGRVSLFIDESPALTPSEVRARARRQARQCGQLGLIVVDYLQLMSGSVGTTDENRATVIGEISRGLKSRAKEPKAAQQANTDAMTAVLKKLKSLGLGEDGIRTTGYDLQPEFDYVSGRQVLRAWTAMARELAWEGS
jgi:hypothetical protein